MYRNRIALSTAALSAVWVLAGCSHQDPARVPAEVPVASSMATAAESPTAALPAPHALVDVLYQLAEPAVPGAEKVGLIEGATPADAATIDRFAVALKDGGYLPLTFETDAVNWSDRYPGNAVADVAITTANPDSGGFSFPMEFKPHDGGWQVSQETAKTLLAFGTARSGTAPPAAPAP
ncbi:MAG: hypothetical protein ABI307_09285 [Mycobacterium sp.]